MPTLPSADITPLLAGPGAAASAWGWVRSQLGGGRGQLTKPPFPVGVGVTFPERRPSMLSQPRVPMAAVTVTVPGPAVWLGGAARSPRVAPECTSPEAGFEARAPGLLRRRKQQYVYFSCLPLVEKLRSSGNTWGGSKCPRPPDTASRAAAPGVKAKVPSLPFRYQGWARGRAQSKACLWLIPHRVRSEGTRPAGLQDAPQSG